MAAIVRCPRHVYHLQWFLTPKICAGSPRAVALDPFLSRHDLKMTQRIRIATRESLLAVWQAEYVASALKALHPGVEVELVKMKSQGDSILDVPLAKIGGKGLFVKELEQGLLNGDADIAVHSLK